MRLSDIFNTQAIAAYRSENISNRIPYIGEAYFPVRRTMTIDLKWLKTHKGLGIALMPSNFDAIPVVRPRGQVHTTQEQMPLFRESRDLKEHDMVEIQRIRSTNDPYLQPVLDSVYSDVNDLIEGAEISTERMRMQLLAPINGDMKITIGTSDNTVYCYDYDKDGLWKSKNYLALTGSDTWDNPTTAKPLSDIRKAVQYLASIGVVATDILGNSSTFDYLLENEQVKSALVSVTGQINNFIDTMTVEEVLRRKLGLGWIPYDKMFTDYDKQDKKFYPDDYITILGNGQLGSTWRGTTPEEITTIGTLDDMAQAPVDITILTSGIAVAIQTVYKPSFTGVTTVSQIVLPSFEGMDSIFVIKVK